MRRAANTENKTWGREAPNRWTQKSRLALLARAAREV